MLQIRVERHRCIGAGNCITIAPTAFDWLEGDFAKADIADQTSVDEELLRQAALSCPTQAIVIEEMEELLPWQMRTVRSAEPQRVVKTFMFTDIVKSTNLVEAMGDEAWEHLLRWHDQTFRSLFTKHRGEEIKHVGDGFFVAFDDPLAAIECAVAIQLRLAENRREHGFSPEVRIGLHSSEATRRGRDYGGRGVHQAARIAAFAEGSEILASETVRDSAAGERFSFTDRGETELRGLEDPVRLYEVRWRE